MTRLNTALSVELLPAFKDNYIFVLRTGSSNRTVFIDPGEAKPVLAYIQAQQLTDISIWITHHHHDHIGGAQEIRERFKDCEIFGPPGLENYGLRVDHLVEPGHKLHFAGFDFETFAIPGHTQDHIAFWNLNENILFCGDTLFSLGCGRIFDGSLESLFNSLQKIKKLPLSTRIYCAHQYTLKNCEFHEKYFPQSGFYAILRKEVQMQRASGHFTVPTTLEFELQYNQFLKAANLEKFIQLRKLRDSF